ncbi:MAG TPA: sugar transferase [Symbiobacteriaceae bacterium]|nr:sugar transferase [Symbiobacteriaceae bacterium]
MRTWIYEAFKRIVDFIGSAIGLILLSPIFLIIAAIIKRSSPGPIFFRQQRVGRNGQPFKIVKFRSMRGDAEDVLRRNPELYAKYAANSYKLPEGEDPRITPIGRWLRKTSLDELPQLWNVLVGEMSLVGPRPLLKAEIDEWYRETQRDLLSVRPGMTGLWQVEGRSEIAYPQRADLELRYVRECSPTLDIRILIQTVSVVTKRRGAH